MPTLRMKFVFDSLPAIEMSIKGKTFIFIVDSGAEGSTFTSEVVGSLLDKGQVINQVGVGGASQGLKIEASMRLLGKEIHRVFVSFGLLHIGSHHEFNSRTKFGGLLGQDILSQFSSVVFDYKERLIRFNL